VEQLAGVEPDYVQGTNLQHALAIAGRHLRRHPDAERWCLGGHRR